MMGVSMEDKKNEESVTGVKLVFQELKDNPYKKFNVAFALMSVIPFLVFVYVLAARLFTFDVLRGDIGLIVFISMMVSLLGFWAGYRILKGVISRIIYYAVKAKNSDQIKSEFVASVSHELKNPLSVIKMNLANVGDGLLGSVNEKQKQVMSLSQVIIDRMARLINDLLNLHKMEAGFVEMRRSPCDVSLVMDKQIRELEQLANKKKIKLTRDISGADFIIWADEDKLSMVANNLLSNAIKYTPESGFVKVKTLKVDGLIRMEVEDTAPMISPDNREKIFDKFKRLESSAEGTGLGLAIAKDIVEMHKGKIWAESSDSGNGNKFIVVLPGDLRGKSR